MLRFECKLEPIAVTHLAFGIGILGDGRLFYDCPKVDYSLEILIK